MSFVPITYYQFDIYETTLMLIDTYDTTLVLIDTILMAKSLLEGYWKIGVAFGDIYIYFLKDYLNI